jgi:methionine-R-sulfoxide reductase
MNVRTLFLLATLAIGAVACNSTQSTSTNEVDPKGKFVALDGQPLTPLIKNDEEWRKELSDFEYHVMRQAGTEQAFTGEYWDNHKVGVYTCRACDLPLFDSKTKFDSGTGWPSFYEKYAKGNVASQADQSLGMDRTEVHCARCGGHLGHVFPDGPKPTGLRYCINSVSLKFVEGK